MTVWHCTLTEFQGKTEQRWKGTGLVNRNVLDVGIIIAMLVSFSGLSVSPLSQIPEDFLKPCIHAGDVTFPLGQKPSVQVQAKCCVTISPLTSDWLSSLTLTCLSRLKLKGRLSSRGRYFAQSYFQGPNTNNTLTDNVRQISWDFVVGYSHYSLNCFVIVAAVWFCSFMASLVLVNARPFVIILI